MNSKIVILSLALGASTCLMNAQEEKQPPRGQRPPMREDAPSGWNGPGRPGGFGGQRPVIPLLGALDQNRDGMIDAQELKGARKALKKLDKNRDGKLTHEEILLPRPEGRSGPGGPGAFGAPGRPPFRDGVGGEGPAMRHRDRQPGPERGSGAPGAGMRIQRDRKRPAGPDRSDNPPARDAQDLPPRPPAEQ